MGVFAGEGDHAREGELAGFSIEIVLIFMIEGGAVIGREKEGVVRDAVLGEGAGEGLGMEEKGVGVAGGNEGGREVDDHVFGNRHEIDGRVGGKIFDAGV